MVVNVTYFLFGVSLIAAMLLYQIQREYLNVDKKYKSGKRHKK